MCSKVAKVIQGFLSDRRIKDITKRHKKVSDNFDFIKFY